MNERIFCGYCLQPIFPYLGAVNRAKALGAPMFCGKHCFGLFRHAITGAKTKADRVKEKQLYDAEYRAKNYQALVEKKRAYFQRTYDPVAAAKYRKKRMHKHVQYCQQPEYRKWKKDYDGKHRAKKLFGAFWESHLLLNALQTEILTRITRQEIGSINGTINKSLIRRRDYDRIIKGTL
jgi:hypothetical protein